MRWTLVLLGIAITVIALMNLYRVELEGCDPGNPPESCEGPYAVLWVELGLIAPGGIGVIISRLRSHSLEKADAA
jgi:hypothetical protein